MRNLVLPGKAGEPTQTIKVEKSILFIGDNGSGKSRLGTWIELEKKQEAKVHRISAQKSLDMPDSTTPMSIEIAERNLLFGSPEREDLVAHYRWNKRPATSLLNDYEKLMVYLFSDETEENAKFKAACVQTTVRIEPPRTKLDTVKKVWEAVLPHRELVIGGLRIETRVSNDPQAVYKSSEMSDGERVIFYLIGQCLAAPHDGIIIIDEPELHLHKSVQPKLWSEIEKLRTDCLFVYLTHDVDFAAANACSTFDAVKNATQAVIDATGQATGLFGDMIVNVGGTNVTVRGAVINGVVRISTFFIPRFFLVANGIYLHEI